MNIVDIRARRELLITQSARQRAALGEHYAGLQGPARLAERGINAITWLKTRPIYVGAAVAALIALRPKRVLTLAGKSFAAWRAIRTVLGFLRERGLV